ncbi:MAG: NCS2 family permease [Armatimonadetes bacterium]|nr:NCS2 family permease [Armatimonadota bacterium]
MRWFVRGDLDGFFGLALDNLVQLLLINALCQGVLGFDDALLYGRVMPGAALSILVGNLFYSWQAIKLARESGRTDVCALPYGINTPSLIAYVFLVMLPAKLAAEAAGHPDPARAAWQAGLFACVGSGLIEFSGAFVAERVRRSTPRAALLATLAGIALTFISLPFLYRLYARPLVGLSTLAIVMLTYFGRVRFVGGLPGGLVAVAIGTALSWATGLAGGPLPAAPPGLRLPIPVFADVFAVSREQLLAYLSVIIPMGIFNVVGSLQNVESAEAAGDLYPTAPSLAVNGLGSMLGAFCGSCFPTTIYIGHPGWKALGARAGYSVLNGLFVTVLCLTGTLAHVAWAVPIDAGAAIVLWIAIVITAQAFQATPSAHAPAVVIGLLPGVAAWGAVAIKSSLRVAGYGAPGGPSFGPEILAPFEQADLWLHGAFALEQGFIFTAMVMAAATVMVIERRFLRAAMWTALAAVLSAAGLMHGYQWTPSDTVIGIGRGGEWAAAYGVVSLLFVLARYLTRPADELDHAG